MVDSINSDINEDDEKVLNPLKPQKQFGTKKNKKKKKLGTITSINVIQNNKNNTKDKSKSNPWFAHEKSNSDNININKNNEHSMINPLEQFDISNSNIGGLDASINSNNVTMDNNTTFMKEIKSFMNKNQKNSYAAFAQKRRSMGNNNNKNNISNSTPYPIGVGNYSNKNKIINFDKKAANKGALPVIMKKENQKIINSKQPSSGNQKEVKNNNDFSVLNQTNNNDVSGVNMIDEALKKFGNLDNDESSFLDISSTKKWLK